MTELITTHVEEIALKDHVAKRLQYYIKLGVELDMDVDQYFVDHEIAIAEGKAKLRIKVAEAKVQLRMLNTIIYFSCALVALIYLTKIGFALMQKPIDLSENYFFACYFTIAFSVIGRYFDLAELAPWLRFSRRTRTNEKATGIDVDLTIPPRLLSAIRNGDDLKSTVDEGGKIRTPNSSQVGEPPRMPRGVSRRIKDK